MTHETPAAPEVASKIGPVKDAFGVPLKLTHKVILYDTRRRRLIGGIVVQVNKVTVDVVWRYPGEVTRHRARLRGEAVKVTRSHVP